MEGSLANAMSLICIDVPSIVVSVINLVKLNYIKKKNLIYILSDIEGPNIAEMSSIGGLDIAKMSSIRGSNILAILDFLGPNRVEMSNLPTSNTKGSNFFSSFEIAIFHNFLLLNHIHILLNCFSTISTSFLSKIIYK